MKHYQQSEDICYQELREKFEFCRVQYQLYTFQKQSVWCGINNARRI